MAENKTRRKPITKKVRFEVFKRDSFTCQYCGKSAPDTILEIDHIVPVSKGGDNNISNLITSCFECNRGKSNRKLTEPQTLKAQKAQLENLNKRREQLEMMSKWRFELLDIEREEAKKVIELTNTELNLNLSLTDTGINKLIKLIKKYGLLEIIECSIIAFGKYEAEIAFKKIEIIAKNRQIDKVNPEMKEIFYIRGIARNKFYYFDDQRALIYLKAAYKKGASIEELKEFTLNCTCWSDWVDRLTWFIDSNSSRF